MQASLPLVRMAHLSVEPARAFWVWVTKAGKPRMERSVLGQTVRMLILLAGGMEGEG
jgi:hypothetical protein